MAPAVLGARKSGRLAACGGDRARRAARRQAARTSRGAGRAAPRGRVRKPTTSARKFPEVARAIHAGEAPERAIRGRASPAEAKALVEEGIALLPLPPLPGEAN